MSFHVGVKKRTPNVTGISALSQRKAGTGWMRAALVLYPKIEVGNYGLEVDGRKHPGMGLGLRNGPSLCEVPLFWPSTWLACPGAVRSRWNCMGRHRRGRSVSPQDLMAP